MDPRRLAAHRLRRRHDGLVRASFGHLGEDVLAEFFRNFGYAMALSLLSRLDALCRVLEPRDAVELGSGVSTAVIARRLPADGMLISIDQDVRWVERARRLAGGSARVAYVCVSEPDLLERVLSSPGRVDLLVVDGPAGAERFSEGLAAVYSRLLTRSSAVVVDDTDREENERGAALLADRCGLRKVDYGDPMYTGHRYAILLPDAVAPELLG
jgi:hypothetical protein